MSARSGGAVGAGRFVSIFVGLVAALALFFACTGGARAAAAPLTRSEAMERVPMRDRLNGDESPLSRGGSWQKLGWATSTGYLSGWRWGPLEAYPAIDGAFWSPKEFTDAGTGLAVAARIWSAPGNAGRYLSLWLDMPNPASVETGYELRLTNTVFDKYDIEIYRWLNGAPTRLIYTWDVELKPGSYFGLSDDGSSLTAWTRTEGGITPWGEQLAVADASFDRGFAGLAGSGFGSRMRWFQAGRMPALAP